MTQEEKIAIDNWHKLLKDDGKTCNGCIHVESPDWIQPCRECKRIAYDYYDVTVGFRKGGGSNDTTEH